MYLHPKLCMYRSLVLSRSSHTFCCQLFSFKHFRSLKVKVHSEIFQSLNIWPWIFMVKVIREVTRLCYALFLFLTVPDHITNIETLKRKSLTYSYISSLYDKHFKENGGKKIEKMTTIRFSFFFLNIYFRLHTFIFAMF